MHKIKRYSLALVAALAPAMGFAQGTGGTADTTAAAVPEAVNNAIATLETGATNYAAVIFPYIAKVGLAFVGIGVFYLLFRVWRRFAGGR